MDWTKFLQFVPAVVSFVKRMTGRDIDHYTWREYPPESMLAVADDVRDIVTVIDGAGNVIEDLSKYTLVLKNPGRTAIKMQVRQKLIWTAPGRILKQVVKESKPPAEKEATLETNKDRELWITFKHLNPGHEQTIEVISEHGEKTGGQLTNPFQGIVPREERIPYSVTDESTQKRREAMGISFSVALIIGLVFGALYGVLYPSSVLLAVFIGHAVTCFVGFCGFKLVWMSAPLERVDMTSG